MKRLRRDGPLSSLIQTEMASAINTQSPKKSQIQNWIRELPKVFTLSRLHLMDRYGDHLLAIRVQLSGLIRVPTRLQRRWQNTTSFRWTRQVNPLKVFLLAGWMSTGTV